jgi:hypothetical protein
MSDREKLERSCANCIYCDQSRTNGVWRCVTKKHLEKAVTPEDVCELHSYSGFKVMKQMGVDLTPTVKKEN